MNEIIEQYRRGEITRMEAIAAISELGYDLYSAGRILQASEGGDQMLTVRDPDTGEERTIPLHNG